MNYQMEVEKKIEAYSVRELIVANTIFKNNLSYIPEKTYYKSIERMVKKGKLAKVAKGVYCRPKITRFGQILSNEPDILNYFIGEDKSKGIVIGYRLYNELGITTQISKTIEIYSNVLEGEKKVIKNIKINKINLSINYEIKQAIEELEILQNYNNIEEIDKNKFRYVLNTIVDNYSDEVFIKVLKNIKYKKRTIGFLESILNYNNKENNLSQFLNKTSKYKIPRMEEIYELAY